MMVTYLSFVERGRSPTSLHFIALMRDNLSPDRHSTQLGMLAWLKVPSPPPYNRTAWADKQISICQVFMLVNTGETLYAALAQVWMAFILAGIGATQTWTMVY